MNANARNAMLVLLGTSSLLALPASADKLGIYGGLQVGYSATDTNEDVIELDSDKAIGGYVGYKFIDWLGAEIGYSQLGTFDLNTLAGEKVDSANSNAIEFESVHAALSLWGKFYGPCNVFAKIGAHYGTSRLDKKVDGKDGEETSYSLYYSAGLEYPFTDAVSATVAYENYRNIDILKSSDLGEAGVDVLSLGVLVNF